MTNAFERLSRARTPSQPDIMNISLSSRSETRFKTPPQKTRSKDSFKEFLERQNNSSKRKKEKIEHIKASMLGTHQPQICEKSKELVEKRKRAGSFMERLKAHSERKKELQVRLFF